MRKEGQTSSRCFELGLAVDNVTNCGKDDRRTDLLLLLSAGAGYDDNHRKDSPVPPLL